MSNNIVLTFALNFAALIALICAVYLLIDFHRKKKLRLSEEKFNLEDN